MAAEDKTPQAAGEATRQQEAPPLRQKIIDHIVDGILLDVPVEAIVRQVMNEIHTIFPQYRTGYTTINHRGFAQARYSRQPEGYDDPAGKLPLDFNRFPQYLADLQAGKTVAAADIKLDPRFKPVIGAQRAVDFKATLVVPIGEFDEEVRALFLDAFEVHEWTSAEIVVLDDTCRYLQIAFKEASSRAAQQDEKTHQQSHKIMESALQTSRAALASQLDLDTMLHSMLKNLPAIVEHDSADILLVDEKGQLDDLVSMKRSQNGEIADKADDYALEVLTYHNIQQVLESGQNLIIEDTRRDPDWFFAPERLDIRSAINVALKVQNRISGYIGIYSHKVRFFNEEHMRRLQIFADQTAPVLENARLALQNRQRAEEAEALQAVGMEVASSLSQKEIFDRTLYYLGRVVDFDAGSVQILKGDFFETAALSLQHTHGVEIGAKIPLDNLFEQRFLVEKQPIIVRDMENPPPGFLLQDGDEAQTWMGVPIIYQGRVLGKIVCDRFSTKAFTDREARLAMALATQVAAALENARLYEEVRRSAEFAETLREAAIAVTTSLDLHDTIDNVLAQLKRVVQSERSAVLLLRDGAMEVFAPRKQQHSTTAIGLRLPVDDDGPDAIIYRTGQPLVIADVNKEFPGRFDPALIGKVTSWLGVPTILHGKVTGIIALIHSQANYFSADQARLATAFASQVAAAFENARLYEEARRTTVELENLQRAVETVASMSTLDEALKHILEQLQLLTPCDSGAIFLKTEDGWRLAGCRGFADPDTLLEVRYVEERAALFNQINTQREGLILADALTHAGFQLETQHRGRGWMGVPILFNDQVVGVFTLDSEQVGFFKPSDLNLATSFASQTAAVIENARLYAESRQRTAEAEALRAASIAVVSEIGEMAVLARILEQVGRLVAFDSASIQLLKGDRLEIMATEGFGDPAQFTGVVLSLEDEDSPNSQVVATRVSLVIANTTGWPTFNEPPHDRIKSWMGIPLLYHDKLIGMLTIDSEQAGFYTEAHARQAEFFASQAAVALMNARTYKESLQRAAEAEALQAASAALVTELSEAAVLERILKQVGRLVPFDSASIHLLKHGWLEIVAAAGFADPDAIIGLRSSLEDDTYLSNRVIRDRQPVVMANTEGSPNFSEPPHNRIKSWMGIPLLYRDQVVGVMSLDSEQPGYFTEAHARRARVFASQAAAALENARLYEEARRSADEAETLRQVTAALTSALTEDQVFNAILEQMEKVVSFDTVSVMVLRDDHLEIIGCRGFAHPQEIIGVTFSPVDPVLMAAVKAGSPYISDDVQAEFESYRQPPHNVIKSWMGVPIFYQGRALGMIACDSWQLNQFTRRDAQMATVFANQAAVALENARLFEENRQRATEAETLRAAGTALASSLSPQEVYKIVLEQLQQVVEIDSGTVQVLKDDQLIIVGSTGFDNPDEYLGLSIAANSPIEQMIQQSGETLILNNAQAEFQTIEELLPSNIECWMASPILYKGRYLGKISCDRATHRPFTPDDARRVDAFARQVAPAIENARLYKESQERAAESEMLRAATEAITATLSQSDILQKILKHLAQVVEFDTGTVQVNRGDRFEILAAFGPRADEYVGRTYLMDNPIEQRLLAEKQLITIDDTSCPPPGFVIDLEHEARAWMGIPIVFRGQLLGKISCSRHPPLPFTDRETRLASVFANQAAAALENARLYEEAQRSAEESETLRQAAIAVNASLDLNETLDRILTQLERVVPSESSGALLLREGSMEIIASHGQVNPHAAVGKRFPVDDDGPDARIYQSGLPLVIDDVDVAFPGKFDPSQTGDVTSWLGVPMKLHDQVTGMITLSHTQAGFYTEKHIHLASAFASQAATAVENARLFTALQEELTERERLEAAMVEARKLASLGTLAAGIAHELNSPLQTVTGVSDSLMRRLAAGEEPATMGDNLERLNRNAWRMAKIVRSLVEITRPAAQPAVPVELNALLAQALENINYREDGQREAIQIVRALDGDLPEVICQRAAILQVFEALLSNAVDAMLEGGLLTVRSSYQRGERRAAFEIEDSGEGISKKNQARIFDPFFTTKPVGAGTGLGLSLARSIVQAHGGNISVSSQPSKGTLFRLTLPQDGVLKDGAEAKKNGRYDD